MSTHEIKEQVDKLNKNKNNVVTAIQHFVTNTRDLGQKIKDKGAAEKILLASKDSEKYTATNIPDLVVVSHGPTHTGSVKIKHPTNGSKYHLGEDIKLEFETEHVHLPLTYAITGQEKVSTNQFLIKAAVSHHDKVLIHHIKKDDKDILTVGTYEITVHIIDPTTKSDIVPPDKVTIEVIPKGITIGENTVRLISPSASESPYKTNAIQVKFRVEGPYHINNAEYTCYLGVTNKTTNKTQPFYYRDTRKDDITLAQPLNLQDGEYEIKLRLFRGGTAFEEISHSEPVTFVVNAGSGPGPIPPGPDINIINNIIINNTTNNIYNNVNLPFAMPVNIEVIPNPTYIKEITAQTINISINITKDGSSREVAERIKEVIMVESKDGKLQFKLKQDVIFKEGGKYNLFIILFRDKVIFRKIINVIIRDEKTVKKEAKLASIINEIRNDIKNGLATSINSIKIKLDETSKNEDLKPYFKEMQPLFMFNDYNILKSEAEKLMNKIGTKPQVGGVCGAIINRVNEYQYYFKLLDLFKKSKETETISDYLYILENFNKQKDALENITKSINKSQQDNLERRKPQDSALKVISKIKTATVLVEDNK